jgi:hypothetical protein
MRAAEQIIVGLGKAGTSGPAAPNNFFTSDVSSWAFEQLATAPSSVYDATTQKTWQTWMAWNGSSQEIHVAAYDHVALSWSQTYLCGDVTMMNDDHGMPALCRDSDGYWWVFYGPHGQSMQYSRTKNVDDPSAWLPQNNIADLVGGYTYSHPTFLAGKIYLFLREFNSTNNNYPLKLRIGTVTSGTISWAASVSLLDWAASRCYQGNHILVGTDIHFVMTQADTPDTTRKDVFYFIYETTTGNVCSFQKVTTTAPASQPISLASSQTSFRIVNQTGVSHEGFIPVWCFDNSGTPQPQIVYMDGPLGGPYALNHITWNGSAWVGTGVDFFSTGGIYNHRFDAYSVVPQPSGAIKVIWPKTGSAFDRGSGTLAQRSRDSAGTWSAISDYFVATGALPLDVPNMVRDGVAGYRLAAAETTGLATTQASGVRGYAFSDSGLLQRIPAAARTYSMQAEHYFNRMTVAPSSARAALINALILGLQADGLWEKIDGIGLCKAHDRQAGRLNLRKGNWELSEVDTPNLTFVTDGYFQGNGTSSYLTSANCTPQSLVAQNAAIGNSQLLRYALNSAHWWNWTGAVGNATAPGGFSETASNHTFAVLTGANISTRLNGGTVTVADASASGFAGVSRTGSTQTISNVNGTQRGPTASTAGVLVNGALKVCAHNTTFNNSPVLAYGWGGGLSAVEMEKLRVRVSAYLTAF